MEFNNKFLGMVLGMLLLVAGVIITTFISFQSVEQLTIEQLIETKATETMLAATQIESHILKVKEELITLSKSPVLTSSLDGQSCALELQKKGSNPLFVTDVAGKIVGCSSTDFVDYLQLNIKEKEYFTTPQKTLEPYISPALRQGESRQIIVSVPLFETASYTPYPNFAGDFKGVLFSLIEINELYYLYLLPVLNGENGTFFIADAATQEIILAGDRAEEFRDIISLVPKISEKQQGIKVIAGKGPIVVTSADLIFANEHWKLIVLTPLETVGKEIRLVQGGHLLSLFIVVLGIIATAILSLLLYQSKQKIQFKLQEASMTLEKLGIEPHFESQKYTPADIVLEPRRMYLFKDIEENNGFDLFISCLNRGFAGLAIVRDDPRRIKQKYNLQKTPFLWLTSNVIDGIPCEKNVGVVAQIITEFMKKQEKTAIYVEGLDYLILENGFEEVVKKLHLLKDAATVKECVIILSLNPELIAREKMTILEALAVDVYGKDLKDKLELTILEKNILRQINDNNIINTLISYKDITSAFNITKPTTRVKIERLVSLGLVTVDTSGRFKTLRVTSRGRKLL